MASRVYRLQRRLVGRAGFTVFEIVVALGVTVVVAILTIGSLTEYREEQNLESSADEVQAIVQDTQRKSITQEDNSVWGVRLTNATSGDDTVIVFRGSSFGAGTVYRTYVLKRNIRFLDPSVGTVRDIVFDALTGAPASYTTFSLAGPSGVNQKLVSVSNTGTVNVSDVTGLSVFSVSPSSGPNNTTVAISTIRGSSFSASSTFKLSRSGQSDIPFVGYTLVDQTTVTGGTLNISGAAVGSWDVVVTNGPTASATLANGFQVRFPPPSVSAVTPSAGTTGVNVGGVAISGSNFQTGAFSVRLSRAGQSDIVGTGFAYVNSVNVSGGSFNLTGAAVGTWDVVFTNPDGQLAVLTGGFSVTSASGPAFEVAVSGANANDGYCTTGPWAATEICVSVPGATGNGSQPIKVRSSNFDSNTQAFSVP